MRVDGFVSDPIESRIRSSGLFAVAKRLYEMYREMRATEAREALIDPNRRSKTKIETLSMGFSHEVRLGEAGAFQMRESPHVTFRPREVRTNVVIPDMFYITDIQGANIPFFAGGKPEDAFNWRDGRAVDYPTLSPANSLTICVSYTGRIPRGLERTREAINFERLRVYTRDLQERIVLARQSRTLKKAKEWIENLPPVPSPKAYMGLGEHSFRLSVSVTGYAGLCW